MQSVTNPYEDVLEYLVDTIGKSLTNAGDDHEKVKPLTEATIVDYFERYIYKDINSYFLIGPDDAIYIYNGRYYFTHRNNEDILLNVIKDAMKRMGIGLVYQKNSYLKIAKQCVSGMKTTPKAMFVSNRDYVVFDNGVLNLETMEFGGFDMRYRTDVVLGFDYNPNAKNALWNKIICETIPNVEMRNAFQEFCGAFLINRSRFSIEYVIYMLGSGRNGKSVVTGAIAEMFGEGLISSFSLQELLFDNSKEYNRAALVGKIANFSDDVTKKDYSGGAYKQLVSGHKMSARNPFGRPFELKEIPYLVVCANEMPPSTDDTVGHYRRTLPIMCPNQISDKDADESLPSRLAQPEVKSAIFNWVIEGRKRLMENNGKIVIGDTIRKEVVQMQETGNSARRWIAEMGMVKVEPTDTDRRWKPMKDWMNMYREYCKDYNEVPKNSSAIGKIFKEKGFESKRKTDGMWWCIGTLGVDTTDEGVAMSGVRSGVNPFGEWESGNGYGADNNSNYGADNESLPF